MSVPRPKHNMAFDGDGKTLPYSSTEVQAIVERAIQEGRILAAIIEMPTGDLAVQVFGPPSRKLLEALETTTNAYRTAIRGH